MTNKEIANYFAALADIMELHKDNPFKIRSYKSTYIQLRKLDTPLTEMSKEDISAMKGIGKNTTDKILEIIATKELQTYNKFKDKTPAGVVEMLNIKGFGPSKIRVVWKELECETVGELLYACNENRLITLKGFGEKTQKDLIARINFYFRSRNKFHYARIEDKATVVLEHIKKNLPNAQVEFTGQVRRKSPIVEQIEILVGTNDIQTIFNDHLQLVSNQDHTYIAKNEDDLIVRIYTCNEEDFGSKQFMYSATRSFIDAFLKQTTIKDFKGLATEKEVFAKSSIPYIVPELRETASYIGQENPDLITEADVKGVIHSHTTYSDGINTLTEMTEYAKRQGYAYIGITDHSKAAFYANGLKEDRVLEQWKEIDELNAGFTDFKIYKGIESDILNNGQLDYEEDMLKGFDFIIASIHSNLKMDIEKATSRLITAIENPYTTMLGHPTGRLLLSRQGYPIDHKKVIDACAANNVSIEMNANPLRLDLDYEWIPYAMEKGVKISINPDAHSTKGIHDIKYGVLAARKGGLTKEFLFNF
jgi:DNA polymerase (family 10)